MNNDVTISKRTPVVTWDKPVDGLYEFIHFMNEVRKIQIINEFLDTHTLTNREITHNSCYDLEIGDKVSFVYLNTDAIMA